MFDLVWRSNLFVMSNNVAAEERGVTQGGRK